MRNYYLFIAFLGILVAIIVGVGFTLTGSPVSQQAIRYDEFRYNDFASIRTEIETYYQNNARIPATLDDVPFFREDVILDPQTKEPYTYTVLSDSTYELCTTFNTDGEVFKVYSSIYTDIPKEHTEGYYCFEFSIPEYIKESLGQEESEDVVTPFPR